MIVKFERLVKESAASRINETCKKLQDFMQPTLRNWPLNEANNCIERIEEVVRKRAEELEKLDWHITPFSCPFNPKIVSVGNEVFGIGGFRYIGTAIPETKEPAVVCGGDSEVVYAKFKKIDVNKITEEVEEEIVEIFYDLLYNVKNDNATYNDSKNSPDGDYVLMEKCQVDIDDIFQNFRGDRDSGKIKQISYLKDEIDHAGNGVYRIDGVEYVLIEMHY